MYLFSIKSMSSFMIVHICNLKRISGMLLLLLSCNTYILQKLFEYRWNIFGISFTFERMITRFSSWQTYLRAISCIYTSWTRDLVSLTFSVRLDKSYFSISLRHQKHLCKLFLFYWTWAYQISQENWFWKLMKYPRFNVELFIWWLYCVQLI